VNGNIPDLPSVQLLATRALGWKSALPVAQPMRSVGRWFPLPRARPAAGHRTQQLPCDRPWRPSMSATRNRMGNGKSIVRSLTLLPLALLPGACNWASTISPHVSSARRASGRLGGRCRSKPEQGEW